MFRLNTLKGTATPLTEVISDFSNLRGTKPQFFKFYSLKGMTITPVTFTWEKHFDRYKTQVVT